MSTGKTGGPRGGLRKYFGLRTKATDVDGKSFIKSLTKVLTSTNLPL